MNRIACLPPLLAALLLSACGERPAAGARAATLAPADASADAELLARGEYMVRIGGCNDCHTPGYAESGGEVPTQGWLVGSPLGYSGPWGTTYAANLRLKVAGMDEAEWLSYTAGLHTRPIMPDFNLRAMQEQDRRAIYRFIRSLGPAGEKAPAYLPPGQLPPPPYMQLVLPAAPQAAAAAPAAAG
jgi:mono/diheme cytochrome c family protein